MKTVFVNPEKCIGCRHCEIACAVEHSETKDVFTAFFENPIPQPRIHVEPGVGITTFPNKCRHCDPAPCMVACPTGALYRDALTGSVLLHGEKCISCGMCAMVCPFSVVTFHQVWNVNIVREINFKCDNCIDRQLRGEEPACVEACKTGALEFGEINAIVKRGRRDYTLRVTTAADRVEEVPIQPEMVKMWREMNQKLTEVGILD